MRPKLILGMIGPCLLAAGCRLAGDITDNLVFNTCLFSDECWAKIYYRNLAGAAWAEFQAADPGHAYSADFANGFKEGFADYLEAGEDGCPRPLPPLKYWKTRYQNPEGRSAIELWFAGFRTGAAVAKASGYRDYVIIPVANCAPPAPDSPAPGAVGSAPGAPVPAPQLLSSAPAAAIGRPVLMPAPTEATYQPPPAALRGVMPVLRRRASQTSAEPAATMQPQETASDSYQGLPFLVEMGSAQPARAALLQGTWTKSSKEDFEEDLAPKRR